MGRRIKKELTFQDKNLERLILSVCINLKEIRVSKKLTQQQVAERAQLAINTVAEIEQQRVENLRLSTITALGDALEIKPLDLFKNGNLFSTNHIKIEIRNLHQNSLSKKS